MSLDINNYKNSNKWYSVIEYILKTHPLIFKKWTNNEHFSVSRASSDFHAAISEFVLDKARFYFRRGIDSISENTYKNITSESIKNRVDADINGLRKCIQPLINNSYATEKTTVFFDRKNAIRFMFALALNKDKILGSDAIDAANNFLFSIGESPLSPRDINEFIILSGLHLGLCYSDICAIQIHYSDLIIKMPVFSNDNVENRTGNLYSLIMSFTKTEDMFKTLDNPDYQRLFCKVRNTPYFVTFCSELFDSFPEYNETIPTKDKYTLSPWEILHFDSFFDLVKDGVQPTTTEEVFIEIASKLFPEEDISSKFKKAYNAYSKSDNYKSVFPGIQPLLHSGNLTNAAVSHAEEELERIKYFFYILYKTTILEHMLINTYNLRSEDSSDNHIFSLNDLKILSQVFPTAFLSLKEYEKYIKHNYDSIPPAGLLLLQLFKKAYTTISLDSEDEIRSEYENYLLVPLLEINFNNFNDTVQKMTSLMNTSGYSSINMNDNFQKLIIDVYKETINNNPDSSGTEIRDKFFVNFYHYLSLFIKFNKN